MAVLFIHIVVLFSNRVTGQRLPLISSHQRLLKYLFQHLRTQTLLQSNFQQIGINAVPFQLRQQRCVSMERLNVQGNSPHTASRAVSLCIHKDSSDELIVREHSLNANPDLVRVWRFVSHDPGTAPVTRISCG